MRVMHIWVILTDVRLKERKECDRKKRDQRLSFRVFYNHQETGISREGG